MQAGLPHRTGCRPLIIHLAPKASTDQLSLRSATQNRTKAARRQSTQCQCPCNVPLCPSREHVHSMASPRSSPWQHVQWYEHADNPLCRRHDELRRVVADDPHEQGRKHLHQLPARSPSPQQQAEHVQLLVATRLVAEQFEQQRQLKPVLPSSRGRRRAVRTRHQRGCNIHATFHTRGRRDGPTTSRTRRVGVIL